MSEIIFLNAERMTPRGLQSQPAQSRGPSGPRVYVREAVAGMWIVHDESDTKGGCFRSHSAAFRFAEEEFGSTAEILVQPQFSAPRKQTVSHFNQSASVAHRALAAQ